MGWGCLRCRLGLQSESNRGSADCFAGLSTARTQLEETTRNSDRLLRKVMLPCFLRYFETSLIAWPRAPHAVLVWGLGLDGVGTAIDFTWSLSSLSCG